MVHVFVFMCTKMYWTIGWTVVLNCRKMFSDSVLSKKINFLLTCVCFCHILHFQSKYLIYACFWSANIVMSWHRQRSANSAIILHTGIEWVGFNLSWKFRFDFRNLFIYKVIDSRSVLKSWNEICFKWCFMLESVCKFLCFCTFYAGY